TVIVGAECHFDRTARWSLSNPGAAHCGLCKQHAAAAGLPGPDLGELRPRPYRWRHGYLYCPANIAVVGDIFSNAFYPIIDTSLGGSIDGIIHTVDQILARTDDQTKIVPGHGPVAARADLEKYRDM